jgi:hypothetical protein
VSVAGAQVVWLQRHVCSCGISKERQHSTSRDVAFLCLLIFRVLQ